MKKLNLILILLIGTGNLSCSSDDKNCLNSKTLDIEFGEEFSVASTKKYTLILIIKFGFLVLHRLTEMG